MSQPPQSLLRQRHIHWVVRRLLSAGPQSRADLSRSLGVSAVTVGRMVEDMLVEGLLEEIVIEREPQPATRVLGRPPRLIRLQAHTPCLILGELGMQHTRLAAVPLGAHFDQEWDLSIATPRTAKELKTALVAAAEQLGVKQLQGVAFSVPGIVNEEAGEIVFSPNLHWSESLHLPSLLQQVFKAPCCLVQEIRAIALAYQIQRNPDQGTLVVELGDGVGGAAIIKGQLYHGSTPLSVEVGHIVIPENQRKCGCGGRGCLETLASNRAVKRDFRSATGSSRASWTHIAEHVETNGVEPWLQEILEAAATAVGAAMNVLGVSSVVITGWPAKLPAVVNRKLKALIGKAALQARFGQVTCCIEEQSRLAGLLTAAIERLVLPHYSGITNPDLSGSHRQSQPNLSQEA